MDEKTTRTGGAWLPGLLALSLLGGGQAAAEWRFDPRQCAEYDALAMHRHDEADAAQEHEKMTGCPVTAFVFVAPDARAISRKPPRPFYPAIYVTAQGTFYGIRNGRREPLALVDF